MTQQQTFKDCIHAQEHRVSLSKDSELAGRGPRLRLADTHESSVLSQTASSLIAFCERVVLVFVSECEDRNSFLR